jgi:hypothetical protein
MVYQIRVKGHLDEEWATWFEPLLIRNEANGEASLIGPVRDQAELFGILLKLYNLSISIVAVQPVHANSVH